jgi:protein-tyrosine phosphatase
VGVDHRHALQLGHRVGAEEGRRLTSPATLPPPRRPGHYAVALVCLGNICRSPTAHVVLEQRLADAGLDDRVEVHSAGTGDWHLGEPMDPRAAAALREAGYDPSRHRARQYDASWEATHDLVLAMDHQNLTDLADPGSGPGDRVRLFRDFDPVGTGGEVPDPWYGGPDGFALVLTMVERTADVLVAELAALG